MCSMKSGTRKTTSVSVTERNTIRCERSNQRLAGIKATATETQSGGDALPTELRKGRSKARLFEIKNNEFFVSKVTAP